MDVVWKSKRRRMLTGNNSNLKRFFWSLSFWLSYNVSYPVIIFSFMGRLVYETSIIYKKMFSGEWLLKEMTYVPKYRIKWPLIHFKCLLKLKANLKIEQNWAVRFQNFPDKNIIFYQFVVLFHFYNLQVVTIVKYRIFTVLTEHSTNSTYVIIYTSLCKFVWYLLWLLIHKNHYKRPEHLHS